MDPAVHEAIIDDIAERLRARLLDEAYVAPAGTDVAVDDRVRLLVDREAAGLGADDRRALTARIVERALGLGPLEPLLRDPGVDEIMVSGTRPVWVERAGRLEVTGARFESEADLRHAIERLLAPAGRRADEAEPVCDARLPDGSAARTSCWQLGG